MVMEDDSSTVYGCKGWGSVLAEAMLVRCGAPYRFIDVEGFDEPGPARDRLIAINPLAQVPTMVCADGTIMTESVAIALLLAERYPEAGLAPPAGSPARASFLRRLVWLGTAVYSTFSYADYPQRWSPSAPEELRERVRGHRRSLWQGYEQALAAKAEPVDPDWAIGVFVSVMSRWGPGRPWFEANCPNLTAIAHAADDSADLKPVWARNFPPA
jgi:GST-like protein